MTSRTQKRCGKFNVEVWSWQEIWPELYRRRNLFNRIAPIYWPKLVSSSPSSTAKSHHLVVWAIVILVAVLFGTFLVIHSVKSLETKSNQPRQATSNRVLGPLEFRQKNDEVTLSCGMTISLPAVPSEGIATKDVGRAFLGLGTRENPSRINLVATESEVYLNIDWAPKFGMPLLKLHTNVVSGLPNNWDCNYSRKGIEIVNEKLVPIFQFYYKNDAHLVVNGVITATNGYVLLSEQTGMAALQLNTTPSSQEFFQEVEALKLRRIFKYPAWKYAGVFDE